MRFESAILALGVDVEDAGSENRREMRRDGGVLFAGLFRCAGARGATEREGASSEVDEFVV